MTIISSMVGRFSCVNTKMQIEIDTVPCSCQTGKYRSRKPSCYSTHPVVLHCGVRHKCDDPADSIRRLSTGAMSMHEVICRRLKGYERTMVIAETWMERYVPPALLLYLTGVLLPNPRKDSNSNGLMLELTCDRVVVELAWANEHA